MSSGKTDKYIRCFLAVSLNEEIKSDIHGLQHQIGQTDLSIRWVKPEGIHLTLKFFGEIHPTLVEKIGKALDSLSPISQSFSVTFNQAGAFPNPRKARVLWVGVDRGRDELIELQKSIDRELKQQFDIAREKRAFHPHLTLARIKRPGNIEQLFPIINNNPNLYKRELNVNQYHFFKSILRPSGAEYISMKTFILGSENKENNHGR